MSNKKQKSVPFYSEVMERRIYLLEHRMQELNDIFQMLLDLDGDDEYGEEEEETDNRKISFSFCMCDEEDEEDDDEDEESLAFLAGFGKRLRKER
jgi:hypothetical protein